MKNYNYNGGKTSHQVNAIKLFKTWFDCDGICQFKYRCNRKTNYFTQYPVYTDSDGISSLEMNIDEMLPGKISGKINRKALQDIPIDYYIDIVCVHKGNPIYGFIITNDDDDITPDLDLIQYSHSKYGYFELYRVNAEWIISQITKPDNIECQRIEFNN